MVCNKNQPGRVFVFQLFITSVAGATQGENTLLRDSFHPPVSEGSPTRGYTKETS